MAIFDKLTSDLASLDAKVTAFIAADTAKDALIASLQAQIAAVPPVVDEQPAVDAASGAVEAIAAKLP